MPYKEKEIKRLYYNIGEVADILGVAPSLLRFWEKEFDEIQPRKSSKGDRQYTEKEIETLKIIYHLVKERGFTLKGARQRLKENKSNTRDQHQVVESLQKIRGFLVEMKNAL